MPDRETVKTQPRDLRHDETWKLETEPTKDIKSETEPRLRHGKTCLETTLVSRDCITAWSQLNTISMFWGNTAYCVKLSGEDSSCYLNKIKPVGFRKCPYYHRLTKAISK